MTLMSLIYIQEVNHDKQLLLQHQQQLQQMHEEGEVNTINQIFTDHGINQIFTDHGICAFFDIGEMLGDGNFAVVHRLE